MIYYFPGYPDHPHPSGGTKTHVRHVQILNQIGFSAAILHVQPGFRYPWIDDDYPVRYSSDELLTGADVLVTNEIMGPAKLAPGIPKVVFNQNSHYTFRGYPTPPTPDCSAPYLDPDVRGTLVLTDYCRYALQRTFPTHPVYVTPHGIDPVRFPLGTAKRKQIAFMPRKHADEAQQVFGWLHFSGALQNWQVVTIDNMSEAQTSQVLQDSLVFFAFGYPEGGTLPPFEAMATGCVVVGYGGFSSDFQLKKFGGLHVPCGDTTTFASKAAEVLSWPVEKLTAWGRECRDAVLADWSLENEAASLKRAWTAILA